MGRKRTAAVPSGMPELNYSYLIYHLVRYLAALDPWIEYLLQLVLLCLTLRHKSQTILFVWHHSLKADLLPPYLEALTV